MAEPVETAQSIAATTPAALTADAALQKYFQDRILPGLQKLTAEENPRVTLIGAVPGVPRGVEAQGEQEFVPGLHRGLLGDLGNRYFPERDNVVWISESSYLAMLQSALEEEDPEQQLPTELKQGLEATLSQQGTNTPLQQAAKQLAAMAIAYATENHRNFVAAVDLDDSAELTQIVEKCADQGIHPELRIVLPRAAEVARADHIVHQTALGFRNPGQGRVQVSNAQSGAAGSQPSPPFRLTPYDTDATRQEIVAIAQTAQQAGARIAFIDQRSRVLFAPEPDHVIAGDSTLLTRLVGGLQNRGGTQADLKYELGQWERMKTNHYGPDSLEGTSARASAKAASRAYCLAEDLQQNRRGFVVDWEGQGAAAILDRGKSTLILVDGGAAAPITQSQVLHILAQSAQDNLPGQPVTTINGYSLDRNLVSINLAPGDPVGAVTLGLTVKDLIVDAITKVAGDQQHAVAYTSGPVQHYLQAMSAASLLERTVPQLRLVVPTQGQLQQDACGHYCNSLEMARPDYGGPSLSNLTPDQFTERAQAQQEAAIRSAIKHGITDIVLVDREGRQLARSDRPERQAARIVYDSMDSLRPNPDPMLAKLRHYQQREPDSMQLVDESLGWDLLAARVTGQPAIPEAIKEHVATKQAAIAVAVAADPEAAELLKAQTSAVATSRQLAEANLKGQMAKMGYSSVAVRDFDPAEGIARLYPLNVRGQEVVTEHHIGFVVGAGTAVVVPKAFLSNLGLMPSKAGEKLLLPDRGPLGRGDEPQLLN